MSSRDTGAWLRFFREDRGWSQTQLAERADVGRVAINRYEQGRARPSAEVAKEIARALSRTVDEVFPPPGSPTPADAVHGWIELQSESPEAATEQDDEEVFVIDFGERSDEEMLKDELDWRRRTNSFTARRNEQAIRGELKVLRRALARIEGLVEQPDQASPSKGRSESRASRRRRTRSAAEDDDPGEPRPALGPPAGCTSGGANLRCSLGDAPVVIFRVRRSHG